MSGVHVVVPAGIDDPGHVSGGNRYDREICDSLRAAGWAVSEMHAGGGWPRPDDRALAALLDLELEGLIEALPGNRVVRSGIQRTQEPEG